jgi:hypothetical protein
MAKRFERIAAGFKDRSIPELIEHSRRTHLP